MHRAGDAFVRLPDRPPPKRLPVGEPSTSDAPYSVHRGLYVSGGYRSSTRRTKFSAICGLEITIFRWRAAVGFRIDTKLFEATHRVGSTTKCTEPVTPSSGFPTDRQLAPAADRRAINLGRSVLGAITTLGGALCPVKAAESALFAICDGFFSHSIKLRFTVCARTSGLKEKGRAQRPGRKSSPSRERFRPPSRRTFRFRVVLLGGLRPTGAPCSAQAGI